GSHDWNFRVQTCCHPTLQDARTRFDRLKEFRPSNCCQTNQDRFASCAFLHRSRRWPECPCPERTFAQPSWRSWQYRSVVDCPSASHRRSATPWSRLELQEKTAADRHLRSE